MTKVYVVTRQWVRYGEEIPDYKTFMSEPVTINGVFSTRQKAEECIKEHALYELQENYGGDEAVQEMIADGEIDLEAQYEGMFEDGYSITELELDKCDVELDKGDI